MLAAGEGLRRDTAPLLVRNPELRFEHASRQAQVAPTTGNAREREFGISQAFKTGGQQARRREAAAATLDAIQAEIADAAANCRQKCRCASMR